MKLLKRIFRLKTILIVSSILSICALTLSYLSVFVHPETMRFLPLFGLGYLIIVAIHILLLITWIFAKSRIWLWVMLGALLLGGNLHFRSISIGWDDENTLKSQEYKVLSYNVRLFDVYNPSSKDALENKEAIFNFLETSNADIYCFQEFYHQDGSDEYNTKETLTDRLKTPYHHARLSVSDYRKQSFGVAIFSKHKIVSQGEVSFDEVEKTFNYCIYVDVVAKKDTVRIYNVHLQSIHFQKDDYALFNEENPQASNENSQAFKLLKKVLVAYPIRAEQARKLTEHMKSSPFPIIVCGDFNDAPMSYTYNRFHRFLDDAFLNTSFGIGRTYAGKVPAGRIDYIFHDQSMGSSNFVIQEEELSDHYAISCSIFKKE
ncbi:MAG: endonuclease/exonuclease/phosphatase family protein [Crocinitomicaceae bacterium]|nr:endonuclease/exonuclease/phosphatase family protein [Flavobacteriales bacterium]NQZ36114.1 endonuclease/exonuclease/phosphatase family protein [Crocinitomicaceae bacterium]